MSLKTKENMIDVLMYLFENYLESDTNTKPDHRKMLADLEDVGFTAKQIRRAFSWLDYLQQYEENPKHVSPRTTSIRHFSADEWYKLGKEGISLLYYLEHNGILNPMARELVIDRAMDLEGKQIDCARLKWVVLMVLFNCRGREAELAWMEDYILNNNQRNGLH